MHTKKQTVIPSHIDIKKVAPRKPRKEQTEEVPPELQAAFEAEVNRFMKRGKSRNAAVRAARSKLGIKRKRKYVHIIPHGNGG